MVMLLGKIARLGDDADMVKRNVKLTGSGVDACMVNSTGNATTLADMAESVRTVRTQQAYAVSKPATESNAAVIS